MKLGDIGVTILVTASAITIFAVLFYAGQPMPPEQVPHRLRYDLITVQTDDAIATAEIVEEVLGITAARQKAIEVASTKCLASRIRIERTHPTIREVETVEQSKAAKERNCK